MKTACFSALFLLFLNLTGLNAQESSGYKEATDAVAVEQSPLEISDSILPYAIGERIEDFRLQNIDGRYISLSDYSDAKGFIVVFTCNNCPCAQDYQQRLVWLSSKYSQDGYPVLAINASKADRKFGESLEDMAARADSAGFNFPYLIDETQGVARRFGAQKTPEVFVLVRDSEENASQGNMTEQSHVSAAGNPSEWAYRLIYSGALDNKPADMRKVTRYYIGEAIALHEEGYKPALERVEPMGCTIEGIGTQGKLCPMEALENRVKEALGD